jgi:protein gp37
MNELVRSYTAEIKSLIGRASQDIIAIGERLLLVKEHLPHGAWLQWLEEEFAWSQQTASRMMQVAQRFKLRSVSNLPIETGALYLLAEKSTPDFFVTEVIERAKQGTVMTQSKVRALLDDYTLRHTPAPDPAPPLRAGHNGTALPLPTPASQVPIFELTPDPPVPTGKRSTFNETNEQVDWAKWTWNPVTGCLHNCVYCYARDIAERFYPEKFAPTFHPERLSAPQYTKVPAQAATDIGWRNVFVCSMADLFGKWVPQEWIEAVLDAVRQAPQWNFLFLTKFPQRLATIKWPENAWVGTSVDEQYRVEIAEKAFRKVEASVKWLSCEPLRERLTFQSLSMFDWVVVGGQSRSTQAPAFQPPWEWVEHLWQQARASNCLLYWKPNLHTRPQEYPGAVVTTEDLCL